MDTPEKRRLYLYDRLHSENIDNSIFQWVMELADKISAYEFANAGIEVYSNEDNQHCKFTLLFPDKMMVMMSFTFEKLDVELEENCFIYSIFEDRIIKDNGIWRLPNNLSTLDPFREYSKIIIDNLYLDRLEVGNVPDS